MLCTDMQRVKFIENKSGDTMSGLELMYFFLQFPVLRDINVNKHKKNVIAEIMGIIESALHVHCILR